jgi:hypothetical protein
MTVDVHRNKNKVIMLMPYFGKWPKYLDLFFKGCENNKWLDIYIFTDCPIPKEYPSNVFFIKFSLKKIEDLMSSKLNIRNYNLKSSYKLCDIKPTYAYMFEDWIQEYDYWGYGDIDLIYGNMWSFYSPKIEKGYDIISSRQEIVSGSFTLIKNTQYNNALFKKLENFENLVRSDRYEAIDETSHNMTIWQGLDKLELPKSSFTYIAAYEHSLGNIKVSFETIISEDLKKNDLVIYRNGQLFNDNQEIAYFHYVNNKKKPYFTYPDWKPIPDLFYINKTGFYKHNYIAQSYGLLKMNVIMTLYYLRKSPSFIKRKLTEAIKFN